MTIVTHYVRELDLGQMTALQELLQARGWSFSAPPHSHWQALQGKARVTAYRSGKLCVQGAGTADFVQFILEPEILREARFGYEQELAVLDNPAMFSEHAGIDESGKGDYFGPLVIACCCTDDKTARALLEAGVRDSKSIGSERRTAELAETVRQQCAGRYALVSIGPESYNRLYHSFGNLNRLLAWGHARALENLLAKVPGCPRAISDQFAQPELVQRALQEKGKSIILEQHPRAEADVAVAAASILARAEFVSRLHQLGTAYACTLPKGAGPAVVTCGRQLVAEQGSEVLAKVAKLHFKTTEEVMGK